MSRSSFRRPFAALAAATVLFTAGCGVSLDGDASLEAADGKSGPTTTTPGDKPKVVIEEGTFEGTGGAVYLTRAADATAEVTTQKMAMDMAMEGLPGVGAVSITAEGEFDNDAGQGHLTMDMSDVFGALDESAGLPDDAGLIEMVVDGDIVYMKSSLFAMLGQDDKPWLKIDSAELGEGGALGGGAQSDPAAFLEFFKSASDNVEEVGTEEVRGVETTHLTATLDLQKLLADASGDKKDELEKQLEGLGAAADSFRSIPAEAWVDADGYMRKFTMTFDFASASEEVPELGDAAMTITVELYDFNEPVDVEIPDPSEVGDLDPSVLSGGN